jgi:putative ABC transport system permease protein
MSAGSQKEETAFKEEHIIYADQNLFTFFSIPLIRGEASNVLKEAGSVVLSKSQALKYFGDHDPVGELMKLNDSLTLKVTGVFKDLPHNTHFNFNIVISNVAYVTTWNTAFNSITSNYIRLREGISFQDFEDKLSGRKKEYFSALLQRIANTDVVLFVQPLKEIVFGNFILEDFIPRSKSLLITFAIISLVILAMAWINYINLWIARNKKREKELATRKINGARGKDFLFQFVTESALINFFAILLAFTLLQLVRTPFQNLFNIQITELWRLKPESQIIFAAVFIFSICLTGFYPSIVASRHSAVSLFKNTQHNCSDSFFASSLVVVQYASAIILILWSAIVYLELNHILDQEVGLDRENVVMVEVPSTKNTEGKLNELVNHLHSSSIIQDVAYGLFAPGEGVGTVNTRRWGTTTQVGFEWNGVSEQYLSLLGINVLAGRNFVSDDRGNVAIISEVATQRLGFKNPADAVGTKLELLKSEELDEWPAVEIIGVMKEYRSGPFFTTSTAGSLENKYQSLGKLFFYKNRGFENYPYDRLIIKAKGENWDATIASISEHYQKIFSGSPFNWVFLDDSMNKVYANEKITRNQVMLFVFLALVIASLGFQGMITHKVISKTKEIGIRKVLGASMSHIHKIILQPSSIQFGISILIGLPVAWYLGQQYLERFSERIELQWWHYALPILVLVLIMLATVGSVVWRAARNNPVEALKYE